MLIDDLIDPEEESAHDDHAGISKLIVIALAVGFMILMTPFAEDNEAQRDFGFRECELRGAASARLGNLARDIAVDSALKCTDELIKTHDIDLIVSKSHACVDAWQEADKIQKLFLSPENLPK